MFCVYFKKLYFCGICGVLDAEVSFDSCIVMMSGCVVCIRCLSSSTVLLMTFAFS